MIYTVLLWVFLGFAGLVLTVMVALALLGYNDWRKEVRGEQDDE